ncbi:DUF3987 domain-containing protein [Rhodobacteraceae bacterium B1Z28]|uniref:DUF3987 domain-containing protein n=1 Tax=Ruegeria haliotis TaxID=2747601 RepID=A0ABX2PLW2_9RHOB|nr:DUF3987 domain-containing protein [Ruegeria haliotis]NVO55008.1 DUF3987 domain-containing protein [Ruegeria haliotis]
MTIYPREESFSLDWPEPASRFLRDERAAAPKLPLEEVFGSKWAQWITAAAEAKSSLPDYVVAALLAVAGSLIGNTRWVSPWAGWSEPPILWTIAIGLPSSGKSPGLDAVLAPQRKAEREMRKSAEGELAQWREAAEIAKIAESTWKEATKAAIKDGSTPPERPDAANPGQEPFLPRLCVADGTVERLAVILEKQARGTLAARDELAGWLQGMTRYSGGGSDRPFWLEAYGGRAYTVERMGRDPVYIDRLSIGVVGGIQPDKLNGLLMNSDDDGLLARFTPIWPDPVPIKRPQSTPDDAFIERAINRLLSLRMVTDEFDVTRPWLIPFTEEARDRLDTLRSYVRDLEAQADGLLLSYIGKLPGMTIRLALVLSYLDWATGIDEEAHQVSAEEFDRAAMFIKSYALPMAQRAYATASLSKTERAARRLVAVIRDLGWERFTSREVLRLDRSGLATAGDLNPVIKALEEGDIVRMIEQPASPNGGRRSRLYIVNPVIHQAGT